MLADWRVLPSILVSVSLILIVFAIVGPIIIENKINDKLASQFLFTNTNGKGYERWINNEQADSGKSYVYVYMFNVTNPAAAAQGAQPVIEELGPWVYRQYLRNAFVSFEDYYQERVVTSTPYTYLIFDADMSPGRSESEIITAPDVAFWSVLRSPNLANNPDFLPIYLDICRQTGANAFKQNNVSNWLFGYTDPLLVYLNVALPGIVPTTVIQFIRNQTSEQDAYNQVKTSTVSCGFPNTKRFQQMVRWQQNSTVDFWREPFTVYGSPGNFFGFYRRGAGTPEHLFWAQVARTLPLEVESDTEFKGVAVSRYIFPESVIENSTVVPENGQFFQNGPKGLFNATAILKVPIFYSWPHFYQGAPGLRLPFIGLKPPSDDDKSFIEIQPIIGANCHSSRKIQGNVVFGGIHDPDVLNISINATYFFPTYWIDIQNELTDDQAEEMRNSLAFYDTAKVGSKAILFFMFFNFTCSFWYCGCYLVETTKLLATRW
jgi:hypothetical protein